jgi:hypothetical protein
MALLAHRVTAGPGRALAALLLVVGAVVGGGAGGCARRVCPEGTIADGKRSVAGKSAFCQSTADPSRAVWVELYPDRTRRQLCPFAGGRPHGEYHAFHPDGARWLEGRYEAGQKVGRWTQWSPQGSKIAEGTYRDGQLIEGAPVGFPATCETVAW